MRLRFGAVAVAIVATDQLTKWLVVRSIPLGDSRELIDGVLHLSHVRNPGAAFGILRGLGGILALAALVGAVAFAAIIVRRPAPLVGVSAALIAGGALGNLIDRVTRGDVVDFVDFRFWPAFNVADSAISIGALLFVIAGVRERSDEAADTTGDGTPADRGRGG